MFDEASERDLKNQLREKIAWLVKFKDSVWRIDIRDEDFQTIKVQLRALVSSK